MGGNTGTQTLTVAVRALATRDLNRSNALRFIGKELLVGLANGSMFALLAGTTAWFWFGEPMIGVIIGVAMRSEEHTSELQSLMRTSYAVFCLKTKTVNN